MSDQCCGTCRYSKYSPVHGYECWNNESEYNFDFTAYDFSCEDWEDKE